VKRRVAFFDIDGTVFRSSLLIELVDALIEQGIFSADVRCEFLPARLAWQNREGTYETYLQAVIRTFVDHIKGVHYGDFADIGRSVVEVQSKKVYRYTRDLMTSLKQDDYFIVAVSQSPKSILDEFCSNYGFDKVYGRIYEIGPQDRLTGVVQDEFLIQNKSNIVKRVIDHNPELTMEESLAVGDTESDIPLLEAVTFPICFNPNQLLYDQARLMKWEVVVERKDVIYHL
jgi:HAD superfamily hydrolase (TIGR01490 family)